MSTRLTVVMYHYVRDAADTPFPGIKGRSIAEFQEQLDYIAKHYVPVTVADVAAAWSGQPLPERACLLTFDDGLVDHVDAVLPALRAAEISGAFFPTVAGIRRACVLDVHKLHFILASGPDLATLRDRVLSAIDENSAHFGGRSSSEVWRDFTPPSRFDDRATAFMKLMLQRELPPDVRAATIDELFRRHVSADEGSFADAIYMDLGDLQTLLDAGMTIGAHGDTHRWLASLRPPEQVRELDSSLALLAEVGVSSDDLCISYPFGSVDDSVLGAARACGFRVGFTTRVAIATEEDDALLLPRLDTNDLPKVPRAIPNEWTLRVIA